MADRFWVGGSGNWSDNTNHWSASSGGAPGASSPASGDNAIFDAASNATAYTVTQDVSNPQVANVEFRAAPSASGTVTFAGSLGVIIFGNLLCLAGMVWTYSGRFTFSHTAGTKTITTNGVVMQAAFSFSGIGGTTQLADNLTCAGNSSSVLIKNGGGFDANGKKVTLTGSTTPGISGAFTFFDFERIGTAVKTCGLTFDADVTMGGTFTVTGNSTINRVLVASSVVGTSHTITAANKSFNNVDWQDIAAAGTAAPFTGVSMGDCGGNTAITFDAPVTQAATGTASFTWSTHGWTTRVPLPQDDVIIPNAFVAGRTITVDMPRLGRDVTFSCTGSPTYNQTAQASLFGNLQFASGMASSGAQNLYFGKRGTASLQTSGVAIAQSIRSGQGVAGFGTTVKLLDALTTTNAVILVGAGNSFDDNGFSVTGVGFQLSASTASVVLGATWLLSGSGTVWNNGSGGSVTANASALIQLTDATATAKTFSGGGKTYNNVWFNNAGAGTFDLVGSNTFNQFKVDAGRSVRFTAATTTTAADWQFGAGCTIGSITAAQHTLAKSGGGRVPVVGATISQSVASPANTFFDANGVNGGNNTNWIFGAYIEAQAGAVAIAGQAAGLRANRKITAQAGAIAIAGEATLRVIRNPAGTLGTLRPRQNSPRRPAQ